MRVGVLPAASRQANGYREYDEDDVARLRLVSGDLAQLWIYPVAPPIGASAAVLVYRYLRPAD